jgi:Tol biopolymer transport system component
VRYHRSVGVEDDDAPATVVSRAKSRSSEPRILGDVGPLAAGEHVGRYVITRPMAEGGMGVIYLAHDPELDRDVAIKLIRAAADDADALEGGARLLREAQAMARLSHPNVVVIHDVGSVANSVFLAMEYVRGQTLRRWLGAQERSWPEILDAFVAAGRGLAAAHAVGIVHRDFKPDNVLVREDGRVQVTDFGLARDAAATDGDAPPGAIPHGLLGLSVTVTGDLVGTPLYMAPEHHRREPIDARTDQFSFAVALFEALCGRHPFGDPKDPRFVERLLAGDPEPPAAQLPARVRGALVRALAPEPDRRFPSVDALLGELVEPASTGGRRRALWLVAAALVVVVVVLAGVLIARRPAPRLLHVARTTQLTRDADLQLDPMPSPDGARLAYASGQLGRMRIVVRPIAGGTPNTVAPDLPGDQRWPQWSPDGRELMFEVAAAGFESRYRVFRVPATGGVPELVIAPPNKSAAMPVWSPDGSAIAYVQFDEDWNPPWEIVVARPDGSAPRTLFSEMRNVTMSTPSWSPDGSHIAFSSGNAAFFTRGNIAPASIYVVAATGGTPVRVTTGTSMDHAPVWLRDGGGLYFVSDRDGPPDIYEVDVEPDGTPTAPPVRLTAGLHAHTLALAGDNRIVCSVFTYRTNLWSVPIPAGDAEATLADARAITSGNQIIESVDPSPDERWLAFDSNRSGNQDAYVMPADGGEAIAVTTDPANDFAPVWSPDGKRLAYHSFRTGTRNVFISDRDGSHTVQITHGAFNHWNPRWSPDGKTFALFADRSGDWEVFTVPTSGGEPQQRTTQKAVAPRWSPDGKTLGFTSPDGLWTMPIAAGAPVRLVAATDIANHNWSRDGSTIYYRRIYHDPALWAVPAGGGEPRRVLRLTDPTRHPDRVEFGVDSRRFLLPLTEHDADLWMLELGP